MHIMFDDTFTMHYELADESELIWCEENLMKSYDQDYSYSFEEVNRGKFRDDSGRKIKFFNTHFLLIQFCNKISKIIYKMSEIIKPVCEIDFE